MKKLVEWVNDDEVIIRGTTYWSIRKVARDLHLSRTTIVNKSKANHIPIIKLTRLFVPRDAVLKYFSKVNL